MLIETTDSWNVQLLRFSAFPVAGASLTGTESWWQNVVGAAPESMTSKPREGLTQSSGQLDETSTLVLGCQPDRIDWQLLPSEKQESVPEYPTIGELGAVMPRFVDIINLWLSLTDTELQRLAFGIVLVKRAANRIEGYNKIAQYLPAITLDPEGSSDFSYSINRPRATTSAIDQLIINRLSKWAVVAYKMFKIPTQGMESLKFAEQETILCRLELDINTAKELAILPREKLKEIFLELVTLAQEIADKGDVK